MKLLRNEKGITLAETLAVIAISAIIVLLIVSVHIYVQKQYFSQSDDALHLTDVTIAAKEITRDIRSYDVKEVTANKIEFTNDIKYELIGDVLQKNDADYLYNIEEFKVEKNGSKIKLEIRSATGQEIKTELFIR